MKRDSRRTSPPQAPAEMVYWQYGPAPCALDLVRNHFAARVVRLAVHVLLRAYLRVFHDLRIRGGWGLGHLRGHLIVANHASHLDALVLISAFPLRRVNRVRSLCAKDYFFRSPLKRTLAFFLANTIPMDRTRFGRVLSRAARPRCQRDRLSRGHALAGRAGRRVPGRRRADGAEVPPAGPARLHPRGVRMLPQGGAAAPPGANRGDLRHARSVRAPHQPQAQLAGRRRRPEGPRPPAGAPAATREDPR